MLVSLDTAYVDTTVADLGFALGLPCQPALHTLELASGGSVLRLRLLGASHQVVLTTPDGELSETVACVPGTEPGLPQRVSRRLPGTTRYEFGARVRRLPPDRFATAVARLRAAGRSDSVLAGEFSGAADALTVLGARYSPGDVSWWTAHAYPQTGELVRTVSKVEVPR